MSEPSEKALAVARMICGNLYNEPMVGAAQMIAYNLDAFAAGAVKAERDSIANYCDTLPKLLYGDEVAKLIRRRARPPLPTERSPTVADHPSKPPVPHGDEFKKLAGSVRERMRGVPATSPAESPTLEAQLSEARAALAEEKKAREAAEAKRDEAWTRLKDRAPAAAHRVCDDVANKLAAQRDAAESALAESEKAREAAERSRDEAWRLREAALKLVAVELPRARAAESALASERERREAAERALAERAPAMNSVSPQERLKPERAPVGQEGPGRAEGAEDVEALIVHAFECGANEIRVVRTSLSFGAAVYRSDSITPTERAFAGDPAAALRAVLAQVEEEKP